MNLIEQLGGYELANSKLLKMDKILKEVYYSHSDAQKANELRQTLLEYRRQHNIFEVGDSVVPKKEYRIGDRVGTIERMLTNSVWIVFDSSSKMLTPIYTIEHTTDEEIKAGKGLEVK